MNKKAIFRQTVDQTRLINAQPQIIETQHQTISQARDGNLLEEELRIQGDIIEHKELTIQELNQTIEHLQNQMKLITAMDESSLKQLTISQWTIIRDQTKTLKDYNMDMRKNFKDDIYRCRQINQMRHEMEALQLAIDNDVDGTRVDVDTAKLLKNQASYIEKLKNQVKDLGSLPVMSDGDEDLDEEDDYDLEHEAYMYCDDEGGDPRSTHPTATLFCNVESYCHEVESWDGVHGCRHPKNCHSSDGRLKHFNTTKSYVNHMNHVHGCSLSEPFRTSFPLSVSLSDKA